MFRPRRVSQQGFPYLNNNRVMQGMIADYSLAELAQVLKRPYKPRDGERHVARALPYPVSDVSLARFRQFMTCDLRRQRTGRMGK